MRVKGAVVHDTPLVESAAMAAVSPPDLTYTPHLSPDLVTKKTVEMAMPDGRKVKRQIGLSEHALEAVSYAGQAHEQFLEPDDEGITARRGFFIGDGTGSGKGREIAGIIADNTNQGRKKHVWISQSQDLIGAAVRDWTDMGGAPGDVFGFSKIRESATPPAEGIAYMTYAELRGGPKDKSQPRNVDQLAAWLGEDFDGVIAFDESHNLGNALDSKGGFGVQNASQQALAGIRLQKLLPKARVVYVSATGATEVKNLAYAERLGIWGRGTPFATKKQFIDQMEKGGVGAMEAVAQSLKATGSYMARAIGYGDGTGREGGQVDFQPVVHHLTEEQRFNYDAVCDGWQAVLGNIDKAIDIVTDGSKHGGRARAAAMSQFWGQQQRFYNQFMTSMQTPSVIAAMEEDRKKGLAPVVAIVNTMKASLDRALAKAEPGDDLDNLDVSPKEILRNYLIKSFPTERMEEYTDENDNIQMRPVMTTKMENGKPVMGTDGKPLQVPVEDPAAVALRDEMLEKIELLKIPASPLDMILQHFGHDAVAEVTGRDSRVVPNDEGVAVVEKRNKHTNGAERSAFMDGKKFAAVVSGAGLTGLDYHADKGAKNQGRRRMYLLQPGWRADGAVQAFGRVNRTNQTTFPIYSTVQIAELMGQKRFISTIARRLEQLGALTKGQQQTGGSGVFSAADNLESAEAKRAMDHFFDDLAAGNVEGLDHRDVMKQLGLYSEVQAAKGKDAPQAPNSMGQFLNRLLALRIDTQNKVFGAFDKYLQQTIEKAMQDDALDTGVANFKADSIAKVSDEPVYHHPQSGAEVRHLVTKAKKKSTKRHWRENEQGQERPMKFVRNNQSGKVWAVYKALDWTNPETGSVVPQFRLRGVSSSNLVPQTDLMAWQNKYEEIDPADAKADWEQQYNDTPAHVESEEHFLVGALLPVWDRIPGEKPKIYRIRTEDGQTVVGRHVPAKHVPQMLKAMGVNPVTRTGEKQHDAAAVHGRLEKGHATAVLANGWKLKPVRVQHERRIELTGPSGFHLKELAADGVIKEKIGNDVRFFIPVGAAGAEVFKRITKSRPVTDLKDMDGNPVSLSQASLQVLGDVSEDVKAEAVRALRKLFPLHTYADED